MLHTNRIKTLGMLLVLMFGMMAGAALVGAEDLTAEEKFKALVEAGIFEGIDENGTSGLDQNMTRAQLAKIIALVMKLDVSENAPLSSAFEDVAGSHWAAGYIDAASKAGILQGYGGGVFAPSADVTMEQLAAVMVKALGLDVDPDASVEGASDWAAAYVAAAIQAGILPAADDYTQPAQRELLVEAAYVANDAVVTEDGELLSEVYERTGKPVIQVDDYEEVTKAASVTLSGHVFPKEGLTVGGTAVSVDSLGRWSAAIELKPGSNDVAIDAVDALGAASQTKVTITRDVAPTLSPIGNRSGTVGYSVSVTVSGQDEGGDRLTYSASGLPGGIAIDADTGRISGAPTTAGTYDVTVTVTDPGGQKAEQTFTWTVASVPVYSPPSSPPSNPPADTVIPIVTEYSGFVTVGEAVYGTSNESGTAYLTYRNIDPKPTRAELEALVTNNEAAKQTVSANIRFTFDTASLTSGFLNIYVVDAAGNVSECALVVLAVDLTPPAILSITPESLHLAGMPLPAVMNEDGRIYLVHPIAHSSISAGGITQAELDETQENFPQYVSSIDAVANETVLVPTNGLDQSVYNVIAVDLAGNVSEPFIQILTLYVHP